MIIFKNSLSFFNFIYIKINHIIKLKIKNEHDIFFLININFIL